MGSCGVECLQGAHYGRKEPRGQVPAARAAADRLRPAEPSKPLQHLHHLNHTTSPSGVPQPACLPGRPGAAPEGSWDTARCRAAVCQPGPRSLHPSPPEPHTPPVADGGLAAHAPSGCTPRLRARQLTRTHEWPERRGRECGTDGRTTASTARVPTPLRTRARPALPRHPAGDVAAPVGWKRGRSTGLGMGPCFRSGLASAGTSGAHATHPGRIPPDRSTYPAILPLPLGSFARGTTRAFIPLLCRWREESCLFLCPAPGPSPASPAWPRAVGSPRSGRCLRPSAPLGLPAAAAEPRSTWRAAGRGRDGRGDRDTGDRPFAVPTAPRAAPRLRSRAAPPAPGSSLGAESGRQRAKPRRTAKVSGRRLAAAPRMVSAGGEGRRAVRSAQRPAGIPRRARGSGDRRLSAPRSPPHPVPGLRRDLPPTGAGGAESSAEQGRGLPGGPRRRTKRRRAAGPALRAASEIPRSAGSSKHLRACLWHWQRLEGMEGFIFGNLPLCVFLMLTSPLSRGHGSAPLLRRGDIPATPTLAKGNKLQQRRLNPCLARDTQPPPARQPACSPRSPPRRPGRSEPPGPAAAGNAQERWSDPGFGSTEQKTRMPEYTHHCPSASGDLWSCISTANPLAALDHIYREKGTATGRALLAIPRWLQSS